MKFEIWQAYLDPLPIEDFEHPDMVVSARDPSEAAKLFAERGLENETAVIVRDERGQYFEIELHKEWEIDVFSPTTLDAVCKPSVEEP